MNTSMSYTAVCGNTLRKRVVQLEKNPWQMHTFFRTPWGKLIGISNLASSTSTAAVSITSRCKHNGMSNLASSTSTAAVSMWLYAEEEKNAGNRRWWKTLFLSPTPPTQSLYTWAAQADAGVHGVWGRPQRVWARLQWYPNGGWGPRPRRRMAVKPIVGHVGRRSFNAAHGLIWWHILFNVIIFLPKLNEGNGQRIPRRPGTYALVIAKASGWSNALQELNSSIFEQVLVK